MNSLCPTGRSTIDWTDPCVRSTWSALAPAALVIAFCRWHIPTPAPFRKITGFIKSPFESFLTLPEAEAYDADDEKQTSSNSSGEEQKEKKAPFWLTAVLVGAALLEVGAWLAVAVYLFVLDGRDEAWRGLVMAAVWLYAALKPALVSRPTPHYDIFALYIVSFLGSILVLGGSLYTHKVLFSPLPSRFVLAAYIANTLLISILLLVELSRPLTLPSARVKQEDIGKSLSPEDYTSLWGWISFGWVTPLVRSGTNETLNEDDVWQMSPTMGARPVFLKFSDLKRKSLLRQLWASNSKDLL